MDACYKGCDDVQVDNCYFFMPDGMTFGYSGIAVESADGSFIENVKISILKWMVSARRFLFGLETDSGMMKRMSAVFRYFHKNVQAKMLKCLLL